MKILFSIILFFEITIIISQTPNTSINRYATTEDASFWPSVNKGDYIFFTGNTRNGAAIFAGGTVFHVQLPVGKKILIWKGNYQRIFIDGKFCESTENQPTIITNLGGQVRWGESYFNDNRRTLELVDFEYLYVTGKYDAEAQTGHPDFLGHNNGDDFDSANYYTKFGMWGNPKWSGNRTNDGFFSNVVRIRGFTKLKMSYIATSEGGFAGFNIKTDNPITPKRVEIDIQDCFAGWHESEGFYVSFSSGANNQDLTKLIFKNNIMAYCGAESLQTDNLTSGSIITNNVAINGACFYRRPFQDGFQDGLHQFSFVEGGVTVQNNIMIGGNSLHQIRFKDPGPGRAFPSATKKVILRNNYYGYSRTNLAFVWEGDGITPYEVDGNIYGPISVPTTRDAYNNVNSWKQFYRICNIKNAITLKNLIYPVGKPLFKINECGSSTVTSINNNQKEAPLVEFLNSGFSEKTDYRKTTFWSAQYKTADKNGTFIPYKVGDIVFFYDENGNTKYYRCISNHAGDFNPNSASTQWEPIQWNDEDLPPLDLRLKPDSFYDQKKMGLTYSYSIFDLPTETKQESLSFKIYPNPSSSEVTIILPNKLINASDHLEITIMDLLGKKILSKSTNNSRNFENMKVTNLTKGIYIITVSNLKTSFIEKLVIQ